MEPETRETIDKLGIALSFLLAATAVLGEALGWWNDLGVLLGVVSVLLGGVSIVDLSGRRLVRAFGGLDRKQDVMLDKQDAMHGELRRVREVLEERLPPPG